MHVRSHRLSLVALLVAAACTAAEDAPQVVSDPTADSAPGQEYPDLNVRQLQLRASEPRPVEDSALPPRSLDAPRFEPAADVDWLGTDEAVLALEHGRTVRAYPAVDGPSAGHRLEPVTHLDTFWFAWAAHRPETRLLVAGGTSSGPAGPS